MCICNSFIKKKNEEDYIFNYTWLNFKYHAYVCWLWIFETNLINRFLQLLISKKKKLLKKTFSLTLKKNLFEWFELKLNANWEQKHETLPIYLFKILFVIHLVLL